jgi:hypothetical protein
MAYQLTNTDAIFRTADNAWIPPDLGNQDYVAYLTWVKAGNTPEPAPIVAPPAPLTPAEKLSASGLTVEELKQLLGLE